MTEEEVALTMAMLDDGAKLCGRLYQRSDGTFTTSLCEEASMQPRRPLQFSIASLLILSTFSGGLFASLPWVGRRLQSMAERWSEPTSQKTPPGAEICMGEIEVVDLYDIDLGAGTGDGTGEEMISIE